MISSFVVQTSWLGLNIWSNRQHCGSPTKLNWFEQLSIKSQPTNQQKVQSRGLYILHTWITELAWFVTNADLSVLRNWLKELMSEKRVLMFKPAKVEHYSQLDGWMMMKSFKVNSHTWLIFTVIWLLIGSVEPHIDIWHSWSCIHGWNNQFSLVQF